jgi:hypothetical protein
LTIVDRWCRIVVKGGERFMLYYDDRDYYDSSNIDELYDDDLVFEDDNDNDIEDMKNSWEFDYHSIANELDDE